MEALMRIDRRWIFLIVALVILGGTLLQPVIPLPTTSEARRLFDEIEAVPEGGAIIVAMDYTPASADELDAMTRAVLHHAFSRNLRVLGICFEQQGVGLTSRLLASVAESFGKEAGKDYVFLGFQPDMTAAIVQMGQSIRDVFVEVEVGGKSVPTSELPVMEGITNFDDIALVVEMTGSKNYEKWIDFANARFGQKLATGATGAIATGLYPFLSTGQISGLLRSTRGAADYERLVRNRYPGLEAEASRKMSVQFFAHLMILVFIALANLGYWASRHETPNAVG